MKTCQDVATCRAKCKRPRNHEGEHWHCDVNGVPRPDDVTDGA